MNLLSVNLARSIWLGPMLDLNPRGASLSHILFQFLVDTYKFKKYPSPTEIVDLSNGVKFQDGDFNIGNDFPILVNLSLHNDGVIADTHSSTNHSDAFLEEIYTRFCELFKMPNYQSVLRKKLHLSQVFVSTNKSLEIINPKLKQVSQYLANTVGQGDRIFQLGGISFWPDQQDKFNPAPFTFERTINVPFSENRYYSAAPLQTDQHLELLDKLETILA